jgi:hypothetical protein
VLIVLASGVVPMRQTKKEGSHNVAFAALGLPSLIGGFLPPAGQSREDGIVPWNNRGLSAKVVGER